MSAEEWEELSLGRRGVYFHHWLANDPSVSAVLEEARRHWVSLPWKTRRVWIEQQETIFKAFFGTFTQHEHSAEKEDLLPGYVEAALVKQCRLAFGPNVRLGVVGSRTRGTATHADSDLDLQVWCDPPATKKQKERLKEGLESRPFFENVSVGNVAVKCIAKGLDGIPICIDLVPEERPEEFPCLRGGENFSENAARINSVFENYPTVAAAVIWVKTLFRGGPRPKGLLLEAIASRLASNNSLMPRAVHRQPRFDLLVEGEKGYEFFKLFLDELRDWENSSYGDDLWKDVSKLPVPKQSEYLEGFERMKNVTQEEVDYRLFEGTVMQEVFWVWTPRKGPLHEHIQERIHVRIAILIESAETERVFRRFAHWSPRNEAELRRLRTLVKKVNRQVKQVNRRVKKVKRRVMRLVTDILATYHGLSSDAITRHFSICGGCVQEGGDAHHKV